MIGINRFLLVAALLVALPGFLLPAAYAKSAEIKVCPVRGDNKVKQIDIFDGDPPPESIEDIEEEPDPEPEGK